MTQLCSHSRESPRGSALPCCLRFLFLRGESQTNLGLAIPTVRQWRQVGVPRQISFEDVERVLRACERSSAIGRRDYAVLLLLARLGLRVANGVNPEAYVADILPRVATTPRSRIDDLLPSA